MNKYLGLKVRNIFLNSNHGTGQHDIFKYIFTIYKVLLQCAKLKLFTDCFQLICFRARLNPPLALPADSIARAAIIPAARDLVT